jgi:hypothetical protein
MVSAREELAYADRRVAAAERQLGQAAEDLEALQASPDAQAPLQARLGIVEAALAVQVEAAVAAPAPYLAEALGPAPADGPERAHWHEAAHRIETYRHLQLGLSPSEGALDDDGVEAAIGRRPDDYVTQLNWDHLVRQLDPRPSLEVEPPGLCLEL